MFFTKRRKHYCKNLWYQINQTTHQKKDPHIKNIITFESYHKPKILVLKEKVKKRRAKVEFLLWIFEDMDKYWRIVEILSQAAGKEIGKRKNDEGVISISCHDHQNPISLLK